jgi:hypothetical protein
VLGVGEVRDGSSSETSRRDSGRIIVFVFVFPFASPSFRFVFFVFSAELFCRSICTGIDPSGVGFAPVDLDEVDFGGVVDVGGVADCGVVVDCVVGGVADFLGVGGFRDFGVISVFDEFWGFVEVGEGVDNSAVSFCAFGVAGIDGDSVGPDFMSTLTL